MWKNVGDFLERFTGFKPSQNFIKKESAEIISAVLNVKIEESQVDERNGVLYLKLENPSLKNEIFLRKNEILEALAKKLGKNAPKDLRF